MVNLHLIHTLIHSPRNTISRSWQLQGTLTSWCLGVTSSLHFVSWSQVLARGRWGTTGRFRRSSLMRPSILPELKRPKGHQGWTALSRAHYSLRTIGTCTTHLTLCYPQLSKARIKARIKQSRRYNIAHVYRQQILIQTGSGKCDTQGFCE